jgi:uncharacterized protein YecT (DUF1311 family)
MNMTGLLVVLAATWIFSQSAIANDCEGPESGSAWAGCTAFNELNRADKMLNDSYRKLLLAMEKPGWQKTRKMLIASQRAWLSHRDHECKFIQEMSGGANKAPRLDCQTDMTKARTSYLEEIQQDFN